MVCQPSDPHMLLSMVNMKLRDQYGSFSALCEDLDWNEREIQEKLSALGYYYDPEANAFV